MQPKVSISVVTYNHANFLAQTLTSILEQKVNFAYEIVIGDDASTDGTKDLLLSYSRQYPTQIVPILHQTNVGVLQNYQAVLNRCQGDYIAHLDGDDFMLPGKLQKQADFLDSHPTMSMVVHDLEMVNEKGEHIDNFETLRRTTTIRDLVRFGTYFGGSSKMHRRSSIPPEGISPRTRNVLDWLFHIQNARTGDIGFLSEILGAYRKHPKGFTSVLTVSEYTQDLLNSLAYCQDILLPEKRISHADLRYAKSRLYYFLAERHFQANDIRRGRGFLWKSLMSNPFHSTNPYRALIKWLYPPYSQRAYRALKHWTQGQQS
jgi:glycosyltransferase involved in cell wall biosynthesis